MGQFHPNLAQTSFVEGDSSVLKNEVLFYFFLGGDKIYDIENLFLQTHWVKFSQMWNKASLVKGSQVCSNVLFQGEIMMTYKSQPNCIVRGESANVGGTCKDGQVVYLQGHNLNSLFHVLFLTQYVR